MNRERVDDYLNKLDKEDEEVNHKFLLDQIDYLANQNNLLMAREEEWKAKVIILTGQLAALIHIMEDLYNIEGIINEAKEVLVTLKEND